VAGEVPPGKRKCRLCHALIDDSDEFERLHEESLDPVSRADRESRVDEAVRAEAEMAARPFSAISRMRF
jgi:hypothetical protein